MLAFVKQVMGLSRKPVSVLVVKSEIKAGRRGRGKDDAPNHG